MTPPDLEVRQVAYSDPLVTPMLTELSLEYRARYGDDHPLRDIDAEMRTRSTEFEPPHGGLRLLLADGEPVAGGAFRRHDEHTAELKRIWTHSAHRRQGLGRRLLAELEQEIAERGYRHIYLTTRQPEAKRLYLAAGYTRLHYARQSSQRISPRPFQEETYHKYIRCLIAEYGW